MAPFMAFPTRDGKTLVMVRGKWRMKCPISDLPKWLRFYRGLRDRGGPGPWAEFFTDAVVVLEALTKKLEAV